MSMHWQDKSLFSNSDLELKHLNVKRNISSYIFAKLFEYISET